MDMQPLVIMSAKDLVTEKLREEIYTGNLKPGQELVQEKISEQLGVSRMPMTRSIVLSASIRLPFGPSVSMIHKPIPICSGMSQN